MDPWFNQARKTKWQSIFWFFYDATGELCSDINSAIKGASKAMYFTDARDKNARITSITDHAVSGQNRSFAYDDLGRLTTMTGPWGRGLVLYDALVIFARKSSGPGQYK